MSAWIVSKGHIDVLVQALIVEGLIRPDQASEYGQLLWKENHHSVDVRYREENEVPVYEFSGIEAPLADGAVHHAIRCYHYQCMEWEGFEDEPGMRFILELERIIDERHPADGDGDRFGGEDWPWGFDSIEQAVDRAQAKEVRGAPTPE